MVFYDYAILIDFNICFITGTVKLLPSACLAPPIPSNKDNTFILTKCFLNVDFQQTTQSI
jgi:hypothetical protein